MLAVLVLEALRYDGLGPLVHFHPVLRVLRLEGGCRSLSGGIVHVPDRTPDDARANPQDTAGASRRSTDAAAGPGWANRGMRLDPFRSERDRRTAAVIEILRRRADLRRARGEAVPRALRAAIAEYDRHPHGMTRHDHGTGSAQR